MNILATDAAAEVPRPAEYRLWWNLAKKGASGAARKPNRRRKRNYYKRQRRT